MSYKDYSEEAVKEILRKVSQSSSEEQNTDPNGITLKNPGKADQDSGYDSGEIQIKKYGYNHPTSSEINRLTDTHIIIEKWFESELSEETIWKEIVSLLKGSFGNERNSGEVKKSSSGKKWSHISHSNHETVVRLKKSGRFASLKLIHRVGFWRPQVKGILHGFYTSLILFGVIFGILAPSLELSIGIFSLIWLFVAFIIYRFSASSRKKKQKHLTNFTNKIISQINSTSEK